jgi:hypothetical protein
LGYVDTMNLYEYVGANPTKGVDPTGLSEEECPDGEPGDSPSSGSGSPRLDDSAISAIRDELYNNFGEDANLDASDRSLGMNAGAPSTGDFSKYSLSIESGGMVYMGNSLSLNGNLMTDAQTPSVLYCPGSQPLFFDRETMTYRTAEPFDSEAGIKSEGPELLFAKAVDLLRQVWAPATIACGVAETISKVVAWDSTYSFPTGGETESADINTALGTTSGSLRNQWEKLEGTPWPKDPNDPLRNQDVSHNVAKADGGADEVRNIGPMPHNEHVTKHVENGDFARWGARARVRPR